MSATCRIEDCEKAPHKGQSGPCGMHAARMLRYGSYDLPRIVKACLGCGVEVRRAGKTGKHPDRCEQCSSQRRRELKNGRRRLLADTIDVPFTCGGCGQSVLRKRLSASAPTRCDRCMRVRDYETVKRWRRQNPDRYAELGRQSARRRRARIRNLPFEVFEDCEVYEAHGWTCWICGWVLDPAVRHPADRAPTIDHLLPVSLDGPHIRANVRPACWECNRTRNNRVDGQYAHALILYPSDYRETGKSTSAPPVGVSIHALNTGGSYNHG